METQLNVISDDHIQQLADTYGTPIRAKVQPGNAAQARHEQLPLRIAAMLQSTLDIEEIIQLFAEYLKSAISHESINYYNARLGITINTGNTAAHNCRYQLVVSGEPLGEIALHRHWPFTDEERKIFEHTLCCLIYPLRNAMLYRQALHAAHKDPLTGVLNRSTLDETLQREIKLSLRYEQPLSVIIVDIDHFKQINDTYGHAQGDCVIKAVTDRTATCIRGTDILFRFGGEEFVVVLNSTDLDGAYFLADRIRHVIDQAPCFCNGQAIPVTISAGVACLHLEEKQKDFFNRADHALYQAKEKGRNRICVANDL